MNVFFETNTEDKKRKNEIKLLYKVILQLQA